MRISLQPCITALIFYLPLSVLASQASIYDLTPNSYHDNCFFIANLNHSFIDYKDPFIDVLALPKMLPKKAGKEGGEQEQEEVRLDYQMNVILLNEADISRTSIDSLNINHCTLEMIKEGKCHEEKIAMIDVDQDFAHTVANVMLESDKANWLQYPIDKTGWYCAFVKIHSDAKDELFPIKFEVQQSFGELTVHGYEELETSIILFFCYMVFGILYKCYNYAILRNLDYKDYNLLLKINKFVKIQGLLYKYCAINTVLHMVTVIRYSIINVTSYNHDYFSLALFHFFELAANTIFAVWIMYELLLFSDGFIVLNSKKNSLINIITTRSLTVLLFISFIAFDLEESSVFSVQSYLSDFFKPFAEQNEFNMDINEIGGWLIYAILTLIVIKIIANALGTIKLLKYKNPKLIKKFSSTVLLILMTPIYMFVLSPLLSKIDLLNRYGSFWVTKHFIYTRIPYENFLNFFNFIAICWVWKGADLAIDRDSEGEEEEEFIELSKL